MREATGAPQNLIVISTVVNEKLLHESHSVGAGADLSYFAFLLTSNSMATSFTVEWSLF